MTESERGFSLFYFFYSCSSINVLRFLFIKYLIFEINGKQTQVCSCKIKTYFAVSCTAFVAYETLFSFQILKICKLVVLN